MNTVTVSIPAGATDTTPGNNTSTVSGTVSTVVDLAITKAVGSTTIAVGGTTTFSFVITNAGRARRRARASRTRCRPLLGNATLVGSQVGGGASTASFNITGTAIAGSVTIPAGGTVTVTVAVTGVSSGNYVNTVTVSIPAGATDTTPGTTRLRCLER